VYNKADRKDSLFKSVKHFDKVSLEFVLSRVVEKDNKYAWPRIGGRTLGEDKY
jgi:hypothetical protein